MKYSLSFYTLIYIGLGYTLTTIKFISAERALNIFPEIPIADALLTVVQRANATSARDQVPADFNFKLDYKVLRHQYFDRLWVEVAKKRIFATYWDLVTYTSLLIKIQNPGGTKLNSRKHDIICNEVERLYRCSPGIRQLRLKYSKHLENNCQKKIMTFTNFAVFFSFVFSLL